MPFPVAHGLVAASIFSALQNEYSLSKNRNIILLCASLAIIPDADFAFAWIFGLRGWHRHFTHSIVFGIALGLLAAYLGRIGNQRQRLGLVLGSVSHAPLDALVTSTSGQGTGVTLLWPLASYRFRFGLFDYFSFNFDPRFDPWGEILIHVLKVSLIELAVTGPILVLVLLLRKRG